MILATSSLFVCLEFIGRHPGLLLVLIGVVGEIACDWKEMEGRLARAKRISAILLVVGLMMEFWEAAKSDNEVADTKGRTALVESNNLVLRSNVAALELKIAQTSTNVAKIDPLNQPVSTGLARVSLILSGETNVENVGRISTDGRISTNGYASISFCRLDQVTVGINLNDHVLMCSGWEHPDPNAWSFKFDQGAATYFGGDTWVRDVKNWDVIEIFIPALHRNTEIVGGRIVLTVNAITWNLEIPPQKAKSAEEDCVNFLKNPHPGVIVFGK